MLMMNGLLEQKKMKKSVDFFLGKIYLMSTNTNPETLLLVENMFLRFLSAQSRLTQFPI